MKFSYQYRTSDNKSHTGVISAATRDDVFSQLKAQGIRPGRVEEVPGFFNALFGKGKRWSAIVVLSLAVVALVVVLAKTSRSRGPAAPLVEARSQIYGDVSILQRCADSSWRNVFTDPGDLFLAQFAQPGVVVKNLDASSASYFAEALKRSLAIPVRVADDDYPETAKMKRIVQGMKDELAAYVADGGSFVGYVSRLYERQDAEAKIIQKANADFALLQRRGQMTLDRANLIRSWNAKNDYLRAMGLPTLPLPEGWEDHPFSQNQRK